MSDGVHVKCLHTIKRGDGLVFDAATWRSPEEPEEGGSVYEVQAVSRDVVLLKFGRNTVHYTRIRVGDLVWRSFDPALSRRLKRLATATAPVYTRRVSFAVTARSGATAASGGADHEWSQRQGHRDRSAGHGAAPGLWMRHFSASTWANLAGHRFILRP